MTWWFHDVISSLLSAKWMSESKSAPQITLEGSRTRKKSAKVIDLIWPQLTSVDLRRTGWPVECMSTTWYYMSTFISLAKTAMFASYVPRNAFSAWHDPSYDVIGQILGRSGSWNFQGGRKKDGRKAIEKMVTIERLTKKIFQKNRRGGGLHQLPPPLCRRGLIRLYHVASIRAPLRGNGGAPTESEKHLYRITSSECIANSTKVLRKALWMHIVGHCRLWLEGRSSGL